MQSFAEIMKKRVFLLSFILGRALAVEPLKREEIYTNYTATEMAKHTIKV